MLTLGRGQESAGTSWKSILIFLTWAYGIAWVVWLPVLLGPSGLRIIRYDANLPLFLSLGTSGPLVAAFVAVRYEKGRWGMPSNLFPKPQLKYWWNLLISSVLTIVAFVIIPYMICAAPGH